MNEAKANFVVSPTIILIGGIMKTEEGVTLDSRQPVADDPTSQVAYRALSTSALWWATVTSVVTPMLNVTEGRYALVDGPRHVFELRGDGSLMKMSLGSFLNVGKSESGWRFRTTEPRIPGPSQEVFKHATVLIETAHAGLSVPAMLSSYRARERWNPWLTIIVPHTHFTEGFFRRFALVGHPEDDHVAIRQEFPPRRRVRNESPDPLQYTNVVPVHAEFKVTGLIKDGLWRDPSDLEAARALLQARFDLKIGIWDLASNPTLRSTLLDAQPATPAPDDLAPIPNSAARRARLKLESADVTWEDWARRFQQLTQLGWERRRGGGVSFRLPLAEYPAGSKPVTYPMLQLWLALSKQKTSVRVQTAVMGIDVAGYVKARRDALVQIASPAASDLNASLPVIWYSPGGTASEVDWDARANALACCTPRWVELFARLVEECRHQHGALSLLRSNLGQGGPQAQT